MDTFLPLALLAFIAAVAVGVVMWRRRPDGARFDAERARTTDFATKRPPD